MIPVLICVLISLSVAENDLDILYPELEHSRTIYVVGESQLQLEKNALLGFAAKCPWNLACDVNR